MAATAKFAQGHLVTLNALEVLRFLHSLQRAQNVAPVPGSEPSASGPQAAKCLPPAAVSPHGRLSPAASGLE